MRNEIESASGLAAYSSTSSPVYLAPSGQEVTVRVVPSGQQADDGTPMLASRRNPVWSEAHYDAFGASTAVVDARSGGDAVGNRAP